MLSVKKEPTSRQRNSFMSVSTVEVPIWLWWRCCNLGVLLLVAIASLPPDVLLPRFLTNWPAYAKARRYVSANCDLRDSISKHGPGQTPLLDVSGVVKKLEAPYIQRFADLVAWGTAVQYTRAHWQQFQCGGQKALAAELRWQKQAIRNTKR